MKLALIASAVMFFASPAMAQVAVATVEYPGLQPAGGSEGARTSPSPGTEQALRHQIASLEAGQADYSAMGALTAAGLRYQNGKLQPQIRQWGALVSLKFVSASGVADVYEATFVHARVRWTIKLGSLGKITSIGYKPLS
ncbi:MAG: hypothetical protein H0U98_14315 [Alphaproteobacteria bacterium]|nr:hypothetical protein [Alphaproteobacteria bacterium]